jgi:predicted CXXCH cytochrome family protein
MLYTSSQHERKEIIMKKSWGGGVVGRVGGIAAFALLAAGMLVGQNAVAGIANTLHNLGTSTYAGTGTRVNTFDGTGEICVFCHTPHGADTGASVPLWNRKLGLSGTATYTTYNSLGTSTLDGAIAPVGSVSLACLSCHDGTQAMNVMINQPGSGGYVSGGSALSGTWSGADQSSGKMKDGIITNIGTDLRNDHPIGIQYGGGMKLGNGTAYTAAAMSDGTFRDPDFKGVAYANLNGNNVWWVDTTVSGTNATGRQKTDMLLYTRKAQDIMYDATNGGTSVASGTMSGDQAFVECASCHDPHSENATFLRIPNTGSAVCLACHIK